MLELPKRKSQRLKDYDYSQNGAYFITICTQNRLSLLGNIINGTVVFSNFAKVVEERLLNISNQNGVIVDKYIIMPNHIHAIIFIFARRNDTGVVPYIVGDISKI